MSPFNGPWVDLALARRLEAVQAARSSNYALAYRQLHPRASVGLEPLAGGWLIDCGPGSPVSRAAGLGMRGPVTEEQLLQLEQFFHARRQPPRLDLCPLADPTLLELVRRRGYRLERFSSVFYREIDADFHPAPLPPGLRITQAAAEQAELWLQVTAQGFDNSETPSPETLKVLGPNFYSSGCSAYLAWLDGFPAGGGAMFPQAGVVELGGASTRPAFRRRGVQRALLEARLAAARQAGCDLAVVVAEPGSDSQRNIERAGFRVAYTKVVLILE